MAINEPSVDVPYRGTDQSIPSTRALTLNMTVGIDDVLSRSHEPLPLIVNLLRR